jgi:hypothetical protein
MLSFFASLLFALRASLRFAVICAARCHCASLSIALRAVIALRCQLRFARHFLFLSHSDGLAVLLPFQIRFDFP